MQRPRTRYARCGDVSIAYQVIGQGPIDLLYAPPWLTNVEYAWESPDYARFLTKLARFSRLIFFDKRGTGLSDREIGVPTLEQRSEDILTVLDAAGSKNAALLGASEGGNMACMFAATHPERTTALVLFGCAAKRSWAPDYPWGARPEEFESSITHMLENWGEPFDLADGAPSAANDAAACEWFAAYLRNSAGPKTAERITRLNYEIDIRAILPTIRTPTLVLHREGDRWADVDEGRYLTFPSMATRTKRSVRLKSFSRACGRPPGWSVRC
jgi:pimeloyl-ACP methyl ester carboxylesterase